MVTGKGSCCQSETVEGRDPRQRIRVQGFKPELEGKLGTTFSLANGILGMRGAHPECPSWGRPEFYCAGTYAGGPPELLGFHDPDHILSHPERITRDAKQQIGDAAIWTLPNLPFPLAVRLQVGGIDFSFESPDIKVLTNERMLSIDEAVLQRCLVFRDQQGRRTRVDSTCFVSFADRHLVAMRYTVTPLGHDGDIQLTPELNEDVRNTNGILLWEPGARVCRGDLQGLECITRVSHRRVAVVQTSRQIESCPAKTAEVYAMAGELPLSIAAGRAENVCRQGFDTCLEAHRKAFAEAGAGAGIEFDDNPATVQGFNYGQMHMQMAFSPISDRVGIPIKGLTGHGYRFLNFWDMDFHMFPYYLMTRPEQAHLLLEYRYSQLDAYRENARARGAKGAQVPWETNTRGAEETAPWLCLQEREIHISADAAYMFKLYDDLTGNHAVMATMGAEFAMETARFYASRLVWMDEKQRYELPDIGCPDQYHTFADNNVFISRFAKWNLEHAIALAGDDAYQPAREKVGLSDDEVDTWRRMVAAFYIIRPNQEGIIEEFDGFFDLDPDISGISETYCSHSQAVKQPDVVAAFIPFEADYDEEIRRRNWHYYNARTLHGSSLSLPGMAHAAARCGLNDEALYNLHKSTRMDLDDVNLDTDRGVHVSGGALEWATVVFGFGGLTAKKDGLHFRPNLPRQWTRLLYTVHWQFERIQVELGREMMTVRNLGMRGVNVPVFVDGQALRCLSPGEILTFGLN